MIITVVLAVVDTFFFTVVVLNAACKLHNTMFRKVMCTTGDAKLLCTIKCKHFAVLTGGNHVYTPPQIIASPMSFFDTTPSGRILNRFSKDQEEVDTVLPLHIHMLLQFSMIVTFTLVIISAVFPYLLVAVLVIGILLSLILL